VGGSSKNISGRIVPRNRPVNRRNAALANYFAAAATAAFTGTGEIDLMSFPAGSS
jgi:hypothetical protein